ERRRRWERTVISGRGGFPAGRRGEIFGPALGGVRGPAAEPRENQPRRPARPSRGLSLRRKLAILMLEAGKTTHDTPDPFVWNSPRGPHESTECRKDDRGRAVRPPGQAAGGA